MIKYSNYKYFIWIWIHKYEINLVCINSIKFTKITYLVTCLHMLRKNWQNRVGYTISPKILLLSRKGATLTYSWIKKGMPILCGVWQCTRDMLTIYICENKVCQEKQPCRYRLATYNTFHNLIITFCVYAFY